MTFTRTLAALALVASPALARGPFEVSATALVASGDTNRMVQVNNLAGYTLGAAFRFEIKPGLDHRLHLDLTSMRAKEGTGLEGSAPKHVQFGYDVVYQAQDRLSVFGGLLAMKWKLDEAKATLPDFTDQGARNNEGKGTKFGARIGLEYAFTKQVGGVVSYTQTEFNKKLNPGWYSLGLNYRF